MSMQNRHTGTTLNYIMKREIFYYKLKKIKAFQIRLGTNSA